MERSGATVTIGIDSSDQRTGSGVEGASVVGIITVVRVRMRSRVGEVGLSTGVRQVVYGCTVGKVGGGFILSTL